MSEPDLILLRAPADAPDWFLPPHWDGRWIDRADLPPAPPPGWHPPEHHASATFVPTGRFEVREHDGAVAEVFEARSE
jgi:hypothetical protein